jgi:hypothetical protein
MFREDVYIMSLSCKNIVYKIDLQLNFGDFSAVTLHIELNNVKTLTINCFVG